MISTDVSMRNFPIFLFEPGSVRFAIADNWFYKHKNSFRIRKKHILKNKKFVWMERVTFRLLYVENSTLYIGEIDRAHIRLRSFFVVSEFNLMFKF